MDLLFKKCGKRKYTKRIFLITDGCSNIQGEEDLENIANQINENSIKLNIISLGFMNKEHDNKDNRVKNIDKRTDNQKKAAILLEALISEVNGALVSASTAIDL